MKSGGPEQAPADATPQRKKKKKRKVRTKECVACYTPHVTIHRVKITYRKQWDFICDICWADRCVDNPHYEYGGLWMSGRVMPPESELYAEWLAKRKQRTRGPGSPPAPPPEPAAPAAPAEGSPNAAIADPPAVATLPDAPPPAIDAPKSDSPND